MVQLKVYYRGDIYPVSTPGHVVSYLVSERTDQLIQGSFTEEFKTLHVHKKLTQLADKLV